jgi:2-polyprenyl-3-methyl-5-hydroxy-6-metoxy-1,4-benzoquinol methylase
MNSAIDKEAVGRKIAEHYETVWQNGDAWCLESSEFEQRRFDYQIQLLSDRRHGAALEIGCGSGCLSRRLAEIADRVVAVDISATAIERARVQVAGAGVSNIDFRVANIMDFDVVAEGPWDLVVLSETIYSLGWLYSMFDVGFLVARLHDAMRPGGVLLLANTYGATRDWLLRSWLIDTYRDLVGNIGFQLDREEIYSGIKDSVEFEVLMSLFHRVGEASVLDS